MANFNEGTPEYDWSEGVYVIEKSDPVEGGADGISNRQAKELTRRTRNLHERLTELKQEAVEIASELTALTEEVDTKDAAALNSAKAYSDQKDTAVRSDFAAADTMALQSAKSYADTKDAATLASARTYADTVVAALVGSSPDALNTLNELAAALGDDPNFSATVMQMIGERVMNNDPRLSDARTPAKVDVTGDINTVTLNGLYAFNRATSENVPPEGEEFTMLVITSNGNIRITQMAFSVYSTTGSVSVYVRTRLDYITWSNWAELYHSGNFNPNDKSDISHSHDGVAGLNWYNPDMNGFVYGHYIIAKRTAFGSGQSRLYIKAGDTIIDGVQVQHASSCPWEGVSGKTNANTSTDGLMSALDKVKLNSAPRVFAAGQITWQGGKSMVKGDVNVSHANGSDTYVISHLANTSMHTVLLTPLDSDRIVYLATKTYNSFTVKGTSLAATGRECGFEFVILTYY